MQMNISRIARPDWFFLACQIISAAALRRRHSRFRARLCVLLLLGFAYFAGKQQQQGWTFVYLSAIISSAAWLLCSLA
jgi:hypothetical protein